MVNKTHFSPASENGHQDGLVDEGKYLRQSLLYKQILPRTPSRLKTIYVDPVNLVKKTSCLSVFVAKTQRNLRNPRLINDLYLYNCRDIITGVMSALQIHLFMQNKAKFRKSQLNVTDLLTTNYEKKDTWWSGKNKPNSKPIQTQTNPILAEKMPKQTQFPRCKDAQ